MARPITAQGSFTSTAKTRRARCRALRFETLEPRELLALATDGLNFRAGEILLGLTGNAAAEYRQFGARAALESAAARYAAFGLQAGQMLLDSPTGASGSERLLTHWKLPADKDVQALASELARLPGVAYAEPNYVWSAEATPNDPSFGLLYGLDKIDAKEAWDITKGSSEVVVGVIDTGVDYNHPDLAANIWTNSGEIPGDGRDNDGNGYIDDIHGWNAIANNGNPFDDNRHGTHVAGTIGAVGNNGVGVAGVNWKVKIAAAKFLDANGRGSTTDAIECFQYFNALRSQGVNVVVTNNSWGGAGFSQALADAMAGPILHAVAAGNAGTNNDVTPSYPASFNLPNIITVAATDQNDQYASFSNFGLKGVDIAAPGVNIYSTLPGGKYGSLSGTSMATPHVTGAAALLAAADRTLSAAGLKQELLNGTEAISGIGANASRPTVTDGRLNVNQSLRNLREIDILAPAQVTDLSGGAPTFSSITLRWTAPGDDANVGTARAYDIRYSTLPISPTTNWDSLSQALREPIPLPAGSPQSFRVAGLASGTNYYFALQSIDNKGNPSLPAVAGPIKTTTGTTLFADTFESGLSSGKWTAQAPWGLSTAVKRSGSASAADSPAGSYANYADTSLTSAVINLSGVKTAQVSFWHRYDLEDDYDFGHFEISTNGGLAWTTLASYTGTAAAFQKATFNLDAYAGFAAVRIRFRLESDFIFRRDGWYVDDVELLAGNNPALLPTLSIQTAKTVTEGTNRSVTLNVTLSAPSAVTVNYASLGNTATGTGDFTAASGTLAFDPSLGQLTKTITITIKDDGIVEGTERFFVNLTRSTTARIVSRQATVTIVDNDAAAVASFDAALLSMLGELDSLQTSKKRK